MRVAFVLNRAQETATNIVQNVTSTANTISRNARGAPLPNAPKGGTVEVLPIIPEPVAGETPWAELIFAAGAAAAALAATALAKQRLEQATATASLANTSRQAAQSPIAQNDTWATLESDTQYVTPPRDSWTNDPTQIGTTVFEQQDTWVQPPASETYDTTLTSESLPPEIESPTTNTVANTEVSFSASINESQVQEILDSLPDDVVIEEEIVNETAEPIVERVPHYVERVVQDGWTTVTERIPRYIKCQPSRQLVLPQLS